MDKSRQTESLQVGIIARNLIASIRLDVDLDYIASSHISWLNMPLFINKSRVKTGLNVNTCLRTAGISTPLMTST
jgi:hypothetical protein